MNFILKIIALSAISLSVLSCSSSIEPKTVTITPVGNEMKFEITSFEVKAGQEVTVIMKNTATMAAMKHNVVILTDRSKVQEIGLAALSEEDYLPDHPAIFAATPIAAPGQSTEITFTAPDKPGSYIYICTFPGHYSMMQGEMIVK